MVRPPGAWLGAALTAPPSLCLSSLGPGGAGREVGTLAGPGLGRAQPSPTLGCRDLLPPRGCCGGLPMQQVTV